MAWLAKQLGVFNSRLTEKAVRAYVVNVKPSLSETTASLAVDLSINGGALDDGDLDGFAKFLARHQSLQLVALYYYP